MPTDKDIAAALKQVAAATEKSTTESEKTRKLLAKMDKKLGSGGYDSDGKSSGSSSYRSSTKSSFAEAFDSMGDSGKDIFETNLTSYIKTATLTYGGLINYAASEIENVASVTAKVQAENLTKIALDASKVIGDKSIQTLYGNANKIRHALAEIYSENSYFLNKLGQDYADSADAGASVMADVLAVKKVLRINAGDFSKIVENQMSSYKKFTADIFEDIAFYAEAYASRTSASIYQITNNLTRAVADFDTFGGAAPESLGKLAGFLGELRMDTETVSSLIGKMQSFEGSVGVVRELAGAFQAVLDPAELMNNAFNDPAEALNSIREAMLDAGHSTESLGHKITYFAKTVGISTDAARRFLNGQIDAQQVLENTVKASEKSAESAANVISKYNDSVVDNRSIKETIGDLYETKLETSFNSTFKLIQDFRTAANQFISERGALLDTMSQSSAEQFGNLINQYSFGDSAEKRAEAKKELEKILNAENLQGAAQKQAKELLKYLNSSDMDAQVGEMQKYLDEKGKLSYTATINTDESIRAIDMIESSPEMKKFIETMKKPYEYTETHSDSDFVADTKINVRDYTKEIKKLTNEDGPLESLRKKQETVMVATANLKDGFIDLEKSAEDSKQAIITAFDDIMLDVEDPNAALIKEIQGLRSDLKEVKYVAEITDKGTYNVVLGNEFKNEVVKISNEVTSEAFKAAGVI